METGHSDQTVNVRVITTAGSYPEHGNEKVPQDEQVSVVLGRAAAQLQITDAGAWVAKVKGAEIDVAKSYRELDLHGDVKIDYGRREGAGG